MYCVCAGTLRGSDNYATSCLHLPTSCASATFLLLIAVLLLGESVILDEFPLLRNKYRMSLKRICRTGRVLSNTTVELDNATLESGNVGCILVIVKSPLCRDKLCNLLALNSQPGAQLSHANSHWLLPAPKPATADERCQLWNTPRRLWIVEAGGNGNMPLYFCASWAHTWSRA